MTSKTRERAPAVPHVGHSGAPRSGLDYESALQALLSDVGLSEKQLDEVLNSVEASRAPGGEHLSFDEAEAYETLPAERQQHVDTCQFCAGLIQCFLSKGQITELAREAARAAGARTRVPFRVASPGTLALVALLVLSLLLAFVAGRASA